MRCLHHLLLALLFLVLCLSRSTLCARVCDADGNCVNTGDDDQRVDQSDQRVDQRDDHVHHQGETQRRVAVVGGGIAGSSSAYYVSQLIPNAEITIYEKEASVCGRVQDTIINGHNVEVGGSIYHASNLNVDGFVRQFNLTKLTPLGGSTVGIWDGKEFVFRGSDIPMIGKVVNMVKMFYRYGWAPYNLKNYLDSLMGNWSKLYTVHEPFNSVEEFFDSLGLHDEATSLAIDHFEQFGISRLFTKEILGSMTRVNYNTDVEVMNSFGAAVSAIGSGSDVYGVKEGNKFICSNLASAAKAISKYGHTVTSVTRDGEEYIVEANGERETYDAVIISTPLELSNIELNSEVDPFVLTARKYQKVHVTFVSGTISSEYFHALNGSAPTFVLTVEDPSIPFSSIGRSKNITTEEGKPVSKIFSRTEFSDETLKEVFLDGTVIFKKVIDAYPILRPPTRFVPIILDSHTLYYVNSMESVVSTIETETISAKNIARLLAKKWGAKYDLEI